MDPAGIAAAAGNPGLVVALSVAGALLVIVCGLLWWFVRDRMRTKEKALDERLTIQAEREKAVKEERDKRDVEVQKFRELAESERQQAAQRHYQSIEGRLQAGSQTFKEMQETQKALQIEIQNANDAFKALMTETNREFQAAIQSVRDSIVSMSHTFMRRDDFIEYKKEQEQARKYQEEQLAKIKENQTEVMAQMKQMSAQFDASMTIVKTLFGRIIDEQLKHADTKKDC